MADNPKLVIELVDRSGNMGQAAPGPSRAGGTDVPGSTLAKDFFDKVTEQGVGGQGQAATPSPLSHDAIGTATDNNNRGTSAPTAGPGYQGMQPLNANPTNAVGRLYEADPNITAEEISGVLGLTLQVAKELLEAVRGMQQSQPASPPAPGFV